MAVLLFLDLNNQEIWRERRCEWERWKNFEKSWKSAWQTETNLLEYKCSAAKAVGRVPCKLNNVTNEKHQSSTFERM